MILHLQPLRLWQDFHVDVPALRQQWLYVKAHVGTEWQEREVKAAHVHTVYAKVKQQHDPLSSN